MGARIRWDDGAEAAQIVFQTSTDSEFDHDGIITPRPRFHDHLYNGTNQDPLHDSDSPRGTDKVESGTEREAGAPQTGSGNSIPRDVLNRHKAKRLRYEGVLALSPNSGLRQAVDGAQHPHDALAGARVMGSSSGNEHDTDRQPITPTSSLDEYDFVKPLDRGSFGFVSLVRRKGDPARTYACKQLSLAKVSANEIKKEVDLIRRACHQHIVSVVDDFVNEDSYHIIMDPAADCDLEKYLRRTKSQPRTPPEWEAFSKRRSMLLQWMYCLAVAVRHIHSLGIRHRDIKPENILVHGEKIFLTDFGTSFHSERDTRYTHTSTRGTAKYLPQEAAGNHRFGRSGDIFSLGCVFYEMAEAILRPILSQPFPVIAETYSQSVSDPGFQSKLSEIREHPVMRRRLPERWRFSDDFLTSILQLISNMLEAVPTRRYTADQVVSSLGDILRYTATAALPCCVSLDVTREKGEAVAIHPSPSIAASLEADASTSASPSVFQPENHRALAFAMRRNTSTESLATPDEHTSSAWPAVSNHNGATIDNSPVVTDHPSMVDGTWSADTVPLQGLMKKRITKLLHHVWEERFCILRGTRLSVYKDASSLDRCLEYIDIENYDIACSNLPKLSAFFERRSVRPQKVNIESGDFPFQLVPKVRGGSGSLRVLRNPISSLSLSALASQSARDDAINGTGKTHYFSVTRRDERIDWMRELMLAKALKARYGAGEAISDLDVELQL